MRQARLRRGEVRPQAGSLHGAVNGEGGVGHAGAAEGGGSERRTTGWLGAAGLTTPAPHCRPSHHGARAGVSSAWLRVSGAGHA